jgi:drug/metabolite transporter (DMT)-like permease
MIEHPHPRFVDRLMILSAALLFSTGGAAIKLCSLNGWQVASLRSGIAAVALLGFLPSARRMWGWRTWLVGSAYAGTMICFVLANKLTTAANAIFLQGAAPLYILLLSPLLLHERVRSRQIWFIATLAAGMSMIFAGAQPASHTAPDPLRGNAVAFVAGIFWALTIIGLRWLARPSQGTSSAVGDAPSGAVSAVVCGNLIACLVTLPAALPIPRATSVDWAVLAFLGIFQIAVAYIFMVRGVRSVGALEVSLLLLLEPVLSPVWAWLVHGEQPGSLAIAGGLIIVAATALYTWRGRRSELGVRN